MVNRQKKQNKAERKKTNNSLKSTGTRRAFVAARVDRVPERDIFKPNPASRPSQSSSFGLRVRRCLQPQEDQHPRWLTILLKQTQLSILPRCKI